MSDDRSSDLHANLSALRASVLRASIAGRLHPDMEQRLLQSIVDATVRLFDAEASSIAIFETDPDRLVFRVAAGAQGAGAIGLSVAPTQGIAGYVYSTGQALALSDVGSDPRFNRKAAEKTGYVPRSIAAVPLLDESGSVGVLQVLDKRGEAAFTLRDMELLAVFAKQAATAIAATRVQRDLPSLLRSALSQLDGDLTDAQLESIVSAATAGLDDAEESPLWRVADAVAQVSTMGENEQELVAQILTAVAAHAKQRRRR
ncbi:MAG TPA: GAF domain-containing protein [Candidatus Limnocylindria bacterium]|nr:GAF domain-containing protein [Candidatus Limnocylindria bacterium]